MKKKYDWVPAAMTELALTPQEATILTIVARHRARGPTDPRIKELLVLLGEKANGVATRILYGNPEDGTPEWATAQYLVKWADIKR